MVCKVVAAEDFAGGVVDGEGGLCVADEGEHFGWCEEGIRVGCLLFFC